MREWSERWLASKRRIKPKTRAGYASVLASRINPTFGRVPLNKITREAVEEWVTAMLDEGLSASRVKQSYTVLNAMVKAAVQQGYLARNLVDGVEMTRIVPRERRFLSPGQVVELAESMPPEYRAFVYVLAYGGLRFGEAVALRRRRCDLLHGRLRVVAVLEEHLDRFVAPTPDALVFTSDRGGPLRNGNFHARTWRPVLSGTTLPQDLTPHELRHTCATLLIAQGADPKAIQAQMRPSTISVTFDVYGHLFPGHLDSVFDQLSADHADAMAEWLDDDATG